MSAYLIKRLILMIPTVFLISFMVFLAVHLVPGNIVDAIMAEQAQGGGGGAVDRAAIERAMGLDAPLLVQYGRWLGVTPQSDGKVSGFFQGSLGTSWWQSGSVLKLLGQAWPVTIELGILGLVVGLLIAIPIGIYSALRQDTWGDYLARSFAILCISVPGFWLGTMVIVFPAIWWNYMPSIRYIPFFEDPVGNLKMFIVPAIILGMVLSGVTMRMTRTVMLEVLRQDYIRTAWSKGLKERVVVFRHALKNALIPVITIVGFQVPVLIGGEVIIEQIFGLPGMGRLMINAVIQRDHPLICGIVLVFAVFLVLTNLLIDLTYAFLDPRITYR